MSSVRKIIKKKKTTPKCPERVERIDLVPQL